MKRRLSQRRAETTRLPVTATSQAKPRRNLPPRGPPPTTPRRSKRPSPRRTSPHKPPTQCLPRAHQPTANRRPWTRRPNQRQTQPRTTTLKTASRACPGCCTAPSWHSASARRGRCSIRSSWTSAGSAIGPPPRISPSDSRAGSRCTSGAWCIATSARWWMRVYWNSSSRTARGVPGRRIGRAGPPTHRRESSRIATSRWAPRAPRESSESRPRSGSSCRIPSEDLRGLESTHRENRYPDCQD